MKSSDIDDGTPKPRLRAKGKGRATHLLATPNYPSSYFFSSFFFRLWWIAGRTACLITTRGYTQNNAIFGMHAAAAPPKSQPNSHPKVAAGVGGGLAPGLGLGSGSGATFDSRGSRTARLQEKSHKIPLDRRS